MYDKTKALKKALNRHQLLENRTLLLFPMLESFMAEKEIAKIHPEMTKDINDHCEKLIAYFV